MLDQDLAQLTAAEPDVSLEGIEQGVWAKVEGLDRRRRLEHVSSGVQGLAVIITLITTTAIGVALAQPARPTVMQISSVVAALAPSTLLEPAQ